MKSPNLIQPSETIVKAEDVDDFHRNWSRDYGIANTSKYMDCVRASIYIITVWGKGTGGMEDG